MTASKLTAGLAALALSTFSVAGLAANDSVLTSPPDAPYQAVSALVPLPDFIPGLGQLFVDPATLPAGPFLGYDHDGKLVSTTYMVPLALMDSSFNLDNLKVPGAPVDHVDMNYNAGHPVVEEPHVHIVLWHVSADEEGRVAK